MIDSARLLSGIPQSLRDELILEYKGVAAAWLEGRWKSAGIDAGRFCEVAYSVLEGALSGTYPSTSKKPSNFPEACRQLENKPAATVGDRSLRFLLPKALPPIYEVRNNRNVGHVGGDVISNKMDADFVLSSCSFVLAELIRVFHGCSTHDAQASVNALVERRVPLVWDAGHVKRVLEPKMATSDRVLLLLYSEADWVPDATLCAWTKYSNMSVFRSKVLRALDDDLLIEYDSKAARCMLTPRGIKEVEQRLIVA